MGAVISFLLGYLLGARSGEEGRKELVVAWRTIASSEEVRDLLIGGLGVARDLLRHGAEKMAELLGPHEPGSALEAS